MIVSLTSSTRSFGSTLCISICFFPQVGPDRSPSQYSLSLAAVVTICGATWSAIESIRSEAFVDSGNGRSGFRKRARRRRFSRSHSVPPSGTVKATGTASARSGGPSSSVQEHGFEIALGGERSDSACPNLNCLEQRCGAWAPVITSCGGVPSARRGLRSAAKTCRFRIEAARWLR